MGVGRRVLWLSLPLLGPLALILAWQILWAAHVAPRVLLPNVPLVAEELVRLLAQPEFLSDVWQTVRRTLISLTLSIAIGVPLGILLGQNKYAERSTSGLIDFLRSIPAPALFPLAILFLGISESSKVSAAVYAASLLMIIQTLYGIRRVNRIRGSVLKLAGADRMQIIRLHLLPEMAPFVAAGMRLSASLALVLIVVAEMLMGGGDGLGGRISDAQAAYRVEELYATIAFTGLLGYATNLVLVMLERAIIYWSPRPD